MKNLIKNDPIKNKVDNSWKLTLQTREMIKHDPIEISTTNGSIKKNIRSKNNKTTSRSVPLRNRESCSKTDRTIQIELMQPHPSSMTELIQDNTREIHVKADLVKEQRGVYEQTQTGRFNFYFQVSTFKNYFRYEKYM